VGGAVVLFELDDPCAGTVLFKAEDVLDVGAGGSRKDWSSSPTTNRLLCWRQLLQEFILGLVGILVTHPPGCSGKNRCNNPLFLACFQQFDGLQQKVVEIERHWPGAASARKSVNRAICSASCEGWRLAKSAGPTRWFLARLIRLSTSRGGRSASRTFSSRRICLICRL